MMGAGKTTLGKRLARECRLEFIDLDKEIERRNGVTIATIFEIEGEIGFRAREAQLLTEVLAEPNRIVATGGGIVLNPFNRARLFAARRVLYLRASPELLFARTKNDRSRPLLQVADPLGRIRGLVQQRDPLYREVADVIIETGREMGAVTEQIKAIIETPCRR